MATIQRSYVRHEAAVMLSLSSFAAYAAKMNISGETASACRATVLSAHESDLELDPVALIDALVAAHGPEVDEHVIAPLAALVGNELWLWDAPLFRLTENATLLDGRHVPKPIVDALRSLMAGYEVPYRVPIEARDGLDNAAKRWFGRRFARLAIRNAIRENRLRLFFRALASAKHDVSTQVLALADEESRLLGRPGLPDWRHGQREWETHRNLFESGWRLPTSAKWPEHA